MEKENVRGIEQMTFEASRICENCGAVMTYIHRLAAWVCYQCGYSVSIEEFNNEDVSYIG